MNIDKKNQEELSFIACPDCGGASKSGIVSACSRCGGLGVGTFYKNHFLFWGLKLSLGSIGVRRIKAKFDLVVNLISFLFMAGGFLAFAYWLYGQVQAPLFSYKDLFFWQKESLFLLLFWVGLVFGMFVFYRLAREEERRRRIKKLPAEGRQVKLPSNWKALKYYRFKLDISNGYGDDLIKILEDAFLAADKQDTHISVMHIFQSLLNHKRVGAFFLRLNVSRFSLAKKIEEVLEKRPKYAKAEKTFSLPAKEALIEAFVRATEQDYKKVRPLNLLAACVNRDEDLAEILYDLEIDKSKIENVIAWFRINDLLVDEYKKYKQNALFKPSGNMDRAYTALATPILDHFSYNLTTAAKWGKLGICVQRDKEMENIFKNFESGKTGVLLTGPEGVGKKTIVHGLARLMVAEEVPEFLRDKRLVELDTARLVSGADPSKAQKRMLVLVDEISRAGNVVLYVKNMENLFGINLGGEGSMELSEVLAEAVNRGLFYFIGSTTDRKYVNYIEGKYLDSALNVVKVREPEGDDAIKIVESKVAGLESRYGIFFTYSAIEAAVKLSTKFIYDKYLPAKAIQVLQMTAARLANRPSKGKDLVMCVQRDVAETVTELTEIPASAVAEDESEKLLNLEKLIHKRMINQKEAVKVVADSLRRARTELREGNRPIANFLFLGPTGVGKTELAKSVAEIYFSDEKNMVRLDMSEYQDPGSLRKMIGDKGENGYLTEAVRKKPYTLVLLDELEKAHSDILNVFLQVMDDGRLTDGQGRTINFTNTIIVATSNAGAGYIQEKLKSENHDMAELKEELINNHLIKVMRPELVNRFDGVIVFSPLSRENVVDITKLMLAKTAKMLENKGMFLDAREDGIRVLAEAGYDPKFGARPLRRLLQDRIDNEIAKKLLAGKLTRRDKVIINEKGEVEIEKGREI